MNEFDDDLGRRLGRLGTSPNDSATALAAVRARSQQLHRRRGAVRVTLATGVLALGATAVVVANDARRDGIGERVSVATVGSTTAIDATTISITTMATTTSTMPPTTVALATVPPTTVASTTSTTTTTASPITTQSPAASVASSPSTAPTATTKPSGTSQPQSPPSSSATTVPSTSPGSTRPPKRSSTTRPSTTTVPGSTSEPTQTTAEAASQTFSCAGGSITVRLQGKRIVPVSGPTPAEGFEVKESKFSGQRIEVKFVGGDDQEVTLKIRIRDGVIVQESGN
jgi:hypothetical protein